MKKTRAVLYPLHCAAVRLTAVRLTAVGLTAVGLTLVGLTGLTVTTQSWGQTPSGSENPPSNASSPSVIAPITDEIRPEDRFEQMPPLTLTGPLMREMLLAEMRSQRGEVLQAAQTYLGLANSLKDSRFARRATQWLLRAQQFEPAFGAAQVWIRLAPQSPNAQQIFDGLAIASNNYPSLEPIFLARLNKVANEKNGTQLEATYTSLLRSLLQAPDPKAAYAFLEKLADSKTNNSTMRAAGYVAKANWQIAARDLVAAERENNLALGASNQFAPAVFLGLQLAANNRNVEQSRAKFEQYLQFPMPLTPSHGEARLLYTSLLEVLGKSENAIDLLARTAPNDPSFTRVQLRIATLRAKDGQIEPALQGLRTLSTDKTIAQADQVLIARASGQILREAKRDSEGLTILGNALIENPEQTELIYEYAMTAERLKQYELMEQQLRLLITLQPDQALAYNALGYSFADRNVKLDEAEELIRSAVSLRPDDGMLIDSLGWVFFRQGKFPQAIEQLQNAYAKLPDGEIAAHLGEALWAAGQKEKARDVWKAALLKEPKHPVLLETLKRFNIKIDAATR